MTSPRIALSFALLLTSCGDAGDASTSASTGGATNDTSGDDASTTPTSAAGSSSGASTPTTTDPTADPTDGEVAGLELLPRLAGLWSGPATMTPLGTFPLMNMDIRAASSQVLFSRADLDEQNSLRFAFEVEAPGGAPTLVYRNGGYFIGLLRDSRTALVEQGADAWRFCSTGPQGCDYIDARWSFTGADALIFDVKVKGKQHVYWEATRKETRALAGPFPGDLTPLASDAEFPPMPSLTIDVSWIGALAEDAEVWAILTTTDCDLQLSCTSSRSLRKAASAGATSATLTIDQIHAGDYKLNTILDRNRNMATTLYPDKGDGLGALNQAVTVAPTGESHAKSTIFLTL